jgi:hypothetical protein
MDYCNWVDGFINYTLSNPKNISGGDIKYPCKKCKNKKFLDQDIVMMHLLQKEFIAKFMCWFVHKKTICSLRDHDKNDGCVNF